MPLKICKQVFLNISLLCEKLMQYYYIFDVLHNTVNLLVCSVNLVAFSCKKILTTIKKY